MSIVAARMGMENIISSGIKVTTVTDTVFVVHGNNRSRSPFSNSVCIVDKTHMLMDTGCGLDIMRSVRDMIGIDLVALSHSHPDHTGGTWLFGERSKSEISVPREGAESIGDVEALALRFVGHELAQHWKDNYLPVTGFQDFAFTSCHGDGAEFSTGSNRFIAMATPGHLADHYCLWEPDRKILIGFDIDMSPFGPWYGNPESDIALFKESIARIARLPLEIYISSHARPMKASHFMKRLAAYDSVFGLRDAAVLEAIPEAGPITLDEIVKKSPIYAVDYDLHPDRILKFGETRMVEKHLDSLTARGVLSCSIDHTYSKAR